jgi:membrane-associated protease RseP (regulator of RpoE activity)
MTTRHALRFLTALAAVALATDPASGQSPAAERERPERGRFERGRLERGWIGVSFDIGPGLGNAGRGGPESIATVVDVIADSPADRANIEPGDVLVSINGRRWEEELGRFTETLRSGDVVRIVLDRNGQQREVTLNAAARPVRMVDAPTWSLTFRVDSMADVMYRAMDSLRMQLVQGNVPVSVPLPGAPAGPTVVVQDDPPGWPFPPEAPGYGFGEPPFGFPVVGGFTVIQEVRAPFEFYLFRGEMHDALVEEMNRLNAEIRLLRSEESARTRELARIAAANGRGVPRAALAELRLVRERLGESAVRAEQLREAMARATRTEAGSRRTAQPTRGAVQTGAPGEPDGLFRPLSPYVLGQNRAAGAEVVELAPELAEYFQVEGGVLVVEVAAGTPAAQAGLQPGDVVTHVNGRAVRSIDALRVGLARSDGDPAMTFVRKGRSSQVLLRR